jgi:hypothetical protein
MFLLFLYNNVSKFQCEICELTKHHQVSFSPSTNKSFEPFVLIHISLGPLGLFLNLVIVGLFCLLMIILGPLGPIKGQMSYAISFPDVSQND